MVEVKVFVQRNIIPLILKAVQPVGSDATYFKKAKLYTEH